MHATAAEAIVLGAGLCTMRGVTMVDRWADARTWDPTTSTAPRCQTKVDLCFNQSHHWDRLCKEHRAQDDHIAHIRRGTNVLDCWWCAEPGGLAPCFEYQLYRLSILGHKPSQGISPPRQESLQAARRLLVHTPADLVHLFLLGINIDVESGIVVEYVSPAYKWWADVEVYPDGTYDVFHAGSEHNIRVTGRFTDPVVVWEKVERALQ